MSYSRTIHGPQNLAALSIETHNASIAVTVVDQAYAARQPEPTRGLAREVQRLSAGSQRGVIEVILSTEDGPDSLSRKVIDQAEVLSAPNGIHIVVKDEEVGSASGVTVVNNISGNVVISVGTVTVNGVRIDPRSGGASVSQGIKVTARLPRQSPMRARTRNGDVTVSGEDLEFIDFEAYSGDLHVRSANGVKAKTYNGDLSISRLKGNATLTTYNGDIHVVAVAPGEIEATTYNGDIHVSDPNRLGRSQLKVHTSTHNGDVVKP